MTVPPRAFGWGLVCAGLAAMISIVAATFVDAPREPAIAASSLTSTAPPQASRHRHFDPPSHPYARAASAGVARPPWVGRGAARIRYPADRLPTLAWPDGERRTVRSVIDVARPIAFGDFVWDDAGVPSGPVWIRVDLRLQMLSVFRAGHEIGSTPILYGADRKPTPPGVYPVLERAERHRSTLYDAPMPYMLRLTPDGIAIHASKVRASAATHGCIGVPLAFAKRLFAQVRRGDPVVIVGAEPIRNFP